MTRTAFVINAKARCAGPAWLDEHRAAVDAVAGGGPVTLVGSGDEIAAAVQRALDMGCETVAAGGGDGTLNAVASHLVGSTTRLGVLPLGTLNHFAKDLRIPLDPAQALATIAAGHYVTVDVGEVNGQYFLNNSSLGLYPEIVHVRERQQQRLGRGKWVAFAWAAWNALRRYPFLTVRLVANGEASLNRTPFVFVGNNAYGMEGFQIGQRAALCDGVLSVYVADDTSRWRLLTLGVRALAGRLRQTREFRSFVAERLGVETPHRHLRVATDGEVRKLATPLRYRIHPRALRVIVPPPAGTGAP
ncbi:MAG TPA: diacylglycerol kinase family protein [Albitalea sp.]|jgi:diacylglycerol kinase family enzyme|nr:diacylglycerol kinase family protein [Albitalea sp.]